MVNNQAEKGVLCCVTATKRHLISCMKCQFCFSLCYFLCRIKVLSFGLPLRDGLTADAKHEGQLFLGHRMGSAKMLKVITEAHGGPTFSERGKAAALCFRAPRRNPCHQSSPSPKDKFG